MTIKDKFLKKEETERNEREKSRLKFVEDLGRKLNAALLDPKFIQKVTLLLEEHGHLRFTEGVDVCFDITSGLEVQGSGKYVSRDSYPSTTLLSND